MRTTLRLIWAAFLSALVLTWLAMIIVGLFTYGVHPTSGATNNQYSAASLLGDD